MLRDIDQLSERAATRLARFKTRVALVVSACVGVLCLLLSSSLRVYKRVHANITSTTDSHELKSFPDAIVTTRHESGEIGRGSRGYRGSRGSRGYRGSRGSRGRVVYDVDFRNGKRIRGCSRGTATQPFPEDVQTKTPSCQTSIWNTCTMTVLYNNKEYTVTKKLSSSCSGQTSGTFFYRKKDDSMSSTNTSGIARIALRTVALLSLYAFALSWWKLKYLTKTNPDGSYWCDTYELPEPVQKMFPLYSKRWEEAFLYDKAENVQGSVADANKAIADSMEGSGVVGQLIGGGARVAQHGARLKQYHSQFQMFHHDVAAGAQLMYRVRDGKEAMKNGSLERWLQSPVDYTTSKWWAFLRKRVLMVMATAIVLTSVIDTLIDQITDHTIASLVGSLCIALPISAQALTLHTYKMREAAQDVMKACVERNLLKEFGPSQLEDVFKSDWIKFDVLRIIL